MVLRLLHSIQLEYIEYSEIETEKRILVRDKTEMKVFDKIQQKEFMGNLCIVFNILKQGIVTAYFNEVTDNHATRNPKKMEKACCLKAYFDEKTKELHIDKEYQNTSETVDIPIEAPKLAGIKIVGMIDLSKNNLQKNKKMHLKTMLLL